ncbi:MAG: CYTH domain-containing protein [Bacteroidales bacterium]|nr:CYTH domain-containing protein [Bacteroidales bacterium]
MAKEIERKFLVKNADFKNWAFKSIEIQQGYVSTDPERTVRVRLKDDKAFLTLKSKNIGIERDEWEYQIPVSDAKEILERMCTKRILKTRYLVDYEGLTWEIDEFHGKLDGLVVAEVELQSPDIQISLPQFIGREVSDNPSYYNSALLDRDSVEGLI